MEIEAAAAARQGRAAEARSGSAQAEPSPAEPSPAEPSPGNPPQADAARVTSAPSAARGASAPSRSSRARLPGLDGVRALAVLAVIAFHAGMRIAPGGFLGVDVFFVLSGYLITDLLVAQREARGRLNLRGFWVRRARRLLPALAVLLITVTAAVAVVEPGQLSSLRPALAAAATYSSNWYQALHHVSYFASFGPPPPLQHLWSLAIEEQFYLAWPLLLTLLLTRLQRRRLRALAAWLGALASSVVMAVLYAPGSDPSRVYYGTDTHATALLVGAALALTWPLGSLAQAGRDVARRLDYAGIAGVIVLAWAVGHFSGADSAVYPYGLAVAALAAGGLTAAAAAPGAVSGMLGIPPLRWLGVRSYGIYLWHWPVIALTAAVAGRGSDAPWLWPIEAGIAIALAAASWKWLEEPILRHGFRATCQSVGQTLAGSLRAASRSPARALPVIWAAAALTVACTAGYGVLHPPPASSSGLQRQIARGEHVSSASRSSRNRGPSATTPAPSPAANASAGTPLPSPVSPARPVRGSQVVAIGDSVMLASAQQLHSTLPGIYIDAQVSRQMPAGLNVVRALAASGRLRRVVVVGLGTNGVVTTSEIRELEHFVGSRRDLVLINTFEARPWEHEVNATLAAAARRFANVVLANWFDTIDHRTYLLWSDGVHPRPAGAKVYARMVYRAVEATRWLQPPLSPRPVAVQGSAFTH